MNGPSTQSEAGPSHSSSSSSNTPNGIPMNSNSNSKATGLGIAGKNGNGNGIIDLSDNDNDNDVIPRINPHHYHKHPNNHHYHHLSHLKTNHDMLLDHQHEHEHDHDHDHDHEPSRTPRPKALTPSPPRTRSGSPIRIDDIGNNMVGGESMVLLRTLDFAARKHSCQRRKDLDQTPYINHPIAVANFLASTGITDVRVLQAAILHDTVEDTCTTIEELADNFGTDVARIVEECTDNPTYTSTKRKAEQVRTAPFKSREAQQVKLADKLHNLESIRRSPPVGWGIQRIQAYFVWAKQVTDICSPAHPALGARLQHLYETAYTRVNGKYYPCHPDVGGPMTEEEKTAIDSRLIALKAGEKPHPNPIFF